MSLIPPSTVYEVERDDTGIVVWAVQKALNATAAKPENKIPVDSDFGEATLEAVKRFQAKKGLVQDGVFGAASSKEMARVLAERATTPIPQGLLRGLIEGESGNLIGAVNHTVAGGVDCSYCQRRVYDEDYDDLAVVRRAFDPLYQINLFASRLKGRFDVYRGRGQVVERAWRLATLYHNYPYAADQYSLGRWPNSYALSPQQWVINIGAEMADGTPIQTPHGWCSHYSLGDRAYNDPGTMTKYVVDWTP
jgi:hypothetical protein